MRGRQIADGLPGILVPAVDMQGKDMGQLRAVHPDVHKTHWAYDDIAAAGAAGWINGYEDGTFRPNESVTRIEAVKMINNMLGWSCDRDIVDNEKHLSGFEFEDLERGSWEYYEVMEATLSHNCIHENGKEIWTKAAVAA